MVLEEEKLKEDGRKRKERSVREVKGGYGTPPSGKSMANAAEHNKHFTGPKNREADSSKETA